MKKNIDPNTSLAYLLNAYWEWLTEQGDIPYIQVDCTHPGVQVPAHAVKDNQITLNLSLAAADGLLIKGDSISFSGRFGGKAQAIVVPCRAVRVIYGRDSHQGHQMPVYPLQEPTAGAAEVQEPVKPTGDKPPRKSHLSVVK